MDSPLIGITSFTHLNQYGYPMNAVMSAYIQAVACAGGSPLLIPLGLEDQAYWTIFERLDGILFTGGGDVHPDRYGGQEHTRVGDVDAERDRVELWLAQAVVDQDKPFLGICRGCQLVNVGLGGTLYTHLADQLPGSLQHDNPGNMRHTLVHDVQVEEGTLAATVLGEPIVHVNSHHHQGLRDVAPQLKIAGRSPDGLVEAIELPGHPFGLAVQWHPEWLTYQESTRSLFRQFVLAAEKVQPDDE